MSEPDVLRMDAYRERRDLRLRLGASLHRADPGRAELHRHLVGVTSLLGADRAATVWIDEYGPGLVHPFVVLDLLCDRPRRAFALDPLRRAWENGVPGVFEGQVPFVRGEGGAWTVAVALGSDGTRSWFLVADSVSQPPVLTKDVKDRLMFVAGECSAVVLHRDLDSLGGPDAEDPAGSRPRFAGWPILQDIEGREDDEAESKRIALRFIVARLPRLLVDDDLAIPRDRLRQQAERAREEVQRDAQSVDVGREGPLWQEVLDAFQGGDWERLGSSLLALGASVEECNHLHGAAELYRTAYEIFAATSLVGPAVEAARFCGRVQRRLARWEESLRWYAVALEIAHAGGLPGMAALVLSGLGNVHRERGNLPRSREVLLEALPLARTAGDRAALGGVLHGLAATEHLAGRLDTALAWGWEAVETYPTSRERVMALASLGGILVDVGDLEAAAEAWGCVRELARDDYYRLYSLDALGHIEALRGDRAGFARWAAEADALGWETGPFPAKAEILFYRGLSYRALGDGRRARSYLKKAVAFCEEHRFTRTLFAAEAALSELDRRPVEHTPGIGPATPRVEGLEGVRRGLEELRRGIPVGV